MKKILNIIILFAAVVFCGCSDFDDSELRGRIDGYKNRIEALKAKAETLGKQLADLSYLTNGNVITTVSQDADGKYVVTYKDNKDVEHTVVLATMDDIVDVPIIGVKLDENGVYYWTKCIDGEITWLTDDDGEKFPVSGYTPTISVDADGCWTVDGVQILDASGNPIKATTDATSVFRSAELDGDGNFSLTLGDGSTITLRVFNSLNLKLDAMPVTTVADPSKSITVSYELSGEAKETAIVAVAKAEGLDAVGPYTCAGGTQNITATNAASSIPPYGFTGSYVQNFGTATPRDTKKVLCLGNSFSYYSNPAWMLKEIAWREGHALNIKAHFKGSQTLTQHLSLGFSTDVIEQGGYDFAFLQDQSQNPANYGRDATASILTGLTTLADKVRAASPSCKVILEETWTFSSASYGGFTDFPTFETYNDAGAKAMAKAAGTWVSPIGPAFRQVREGGSGINLYYSDSKHQSEYGAYLKACVNYLVLFGERFGADPADCGLNPDKAAYLRSVAEQIVLGNEEDYFIER